MYTLLLTLGIASGLAIFAQPGAPGSNAPVREGGIFRISLAAGSGIDHLDPALAYTPAAWALLDTVCARLLDVSGQAAAGRLPARPRGGDGLPEGLARPPHVHVHAAQRLPLQRRHPRPGECLRSRDQPHARPGRCLTGRPAGPRHRRRRRGAGREDARCSGRRRPREHARRPVHAPGVRLRGSDDDAVLLRRAADAALPIPRESTRSPARGRTTSPSTGPASASSSGATASTAAGGHTMSTDSTSISGHRRRRRC